MKAKATKEMVMDELRDMGGNSDDEVEEGEEAYQHRRSAVSSAVDRWNIDEMERNRIQVEATEVSGSDYGKMSKRTITDFMRRSSSVKISGSATKARLYKFDDIIKFRDGLAMFGTKNAIASKETMWPEDGRPSQEISDAAREADIDVDAITHQFFESSSESTHRHDDDPASDVDLSEDSEHDIDNESSDGTHGSDGDNDDHGGSGGEGAELVESITIRCWDIIKFSDVHNPFGFAAI
ncbi:hypothetical protein Taro_002263 [Colocasia esculenta]|uniref:Uncharacterized protein n=1 Tax=Colocasia esculenta TaxID=4460 RepID=A0A843TDJ0_COLES|nr:hypothetical protein [Colocasia esculenta]